jgi:hypothetical protein
MNFHVVYSGKALEQVRSIIDDIYPSPIWKITQHGRDCVEIVFHDGRVLVGTPMGDCCANTWIDEVAGNLVGLLGYPLAAIDLVCYVRDPGDPGAYEARDMFVEIIRGGSMGATEVAVLCRCEHNGYYGGWLEWALYPSVQAQYVLPGHDDDERDLEDDYC